jgi:hypothetical protein
LGGRERVFNGVVSQASKGKGTGKGCLFQPLPFSTGSASFLFPLGAVEKAGNRERTVNKKKIHCFFLFIV